MSGDVERIRLAIDDFRRDEAEERVARWRGAGDSHADVIDRHVWLCREPGRELLEQCRKQVTELEHGAMRAHVARVAAEWMLAPARAALREPRLIEVGDEEVSPATAMHRIVREGSSRTREQIARALDAEMSDVAEIAEDARTSADSLSGPIAVGAKHADREPKAGATLELVSSVLSGTGALYEDAARSFLPDESPATALHALASPELAEGCPPVSRFRRVAHAFTALAFERDLSNRMRAEVSHGGVSPRVRIAAIDVPRDVRLAPSGLELGLVSEIAAFEGFGRGLAHVLVAPALPSETRRPVAFTVGRAIGTAFALVACERSYLKKERGLSRTATEKVARASTLVVLMETRTLLASVRARSEPLSLAHQLERGRTELSRALALDVTKTMARFACVTPSMLLARARGRLYGIALSIALRDRYDEDWYRNPRAAEVIRAGASRGGSLSIEAFLAEISAGTAGIVDRFGELLG